LNSKESEYKLVVEYCKLCDGYETEVHSPVEICINQKIQK